ncbi:MAG: hypothetical protein E7607_04060 [Ruminococcaceae bacterium]|nr:hypothetical protein [Oscillospiraceae bacterium]
MDFLKNRNIFSFMYGGIPAHKCSKRVDVSENEYELITTYYFDSGLKFTNIAKKHKRSGAYEWVNYLENIGTENTELITELWDCDVELPFSYCPPTGPSPWFPSIEQNTYVLNPYGSEGRDETDFYSHLNGGGHNKNFLLNNSKSFKYAPIGGRSSEGTAPFFNIHERGKGYIVAVGWTGQWNAQISREENAVRFKSKIEDTEFVLFPGEKIRTSSVVILPYEATVEESQNLWRDLIKNEFSPLTDRIDHLPLCAGFWGGLESDKIIDRISLLDKYEIPVENVWIDAGWAGKDTLPTSNEYEGDWADHVGDLTISPFVHKNGLVDVSNKIKESGRNFILWFEPERVRLRTDLVKEHPEYLISQEGTRNFLLDLGNEEAFNYCLALLTEKIDTLKIDWYRQDFNFRPLPYWRSKDTENRKGITEIKHIMGLYRLWDTLLERFPKLMIDNCASGGNRIDIETLKRSVPLWRSDAQCPANPDPEVTQAHNMNFSLWTPFSATSPGRIYDTYTIRSAYGPAMTSNYLYSSTENFGDTDEHVSWFKKHCEEYLSIRKYFLGDIYHLTEPKRDLSAWCATQWTLDDEGMIQIFKRENSSYLTAAFKLRNIDKSKNYLFTDLDGGDFCLSGKELCEKGFTVTITEARVAKIFTYKKI